MLGRSRETGTAVLDSTRLNRVTGCTGIVPRQYSTYFQSFPGRISELNDWKCCAHLSDELTLILSRRSAEPRSPVFSNEGLAFFEILSPTDKVTPIDGWPAYPSIGEPRTEEPPSPRQSLNLKNDTNPPPGTLAYTTCSSSPSEYSVENISDAREHDTSKATGSRNQAEEPNRPVPKFSPPNVGTEMRRASLMLRPVSSGGPAPQVLSPPPVKAVVPVRRPVRRVVTVPRLLPPTPSPRIRSRPSTAHNASGPMSPASVIPEEKLIQLQVRTPQVESNAPLGYRRSFTHVQGLRARALPTPPLPRVHHFRPLPPLPIASPPNP